MTTKYDFQAILLKPFHVSGMRNIKVLSPDHVRKLVKDHHPAARHLAAAQAKPAFAKS